MLSKLNFLQFKWSTFEFLTVHGASAILCIVRGIMLGFFVLNCHGKKMPNFHFGNGCLKQVFYFYNHHKEACSWVALSRCRQARWAWQPLHGRDTAASLKIAFVLICFVFILFIIIMWGVGQVHTCHQGRAAVRGQACGVHSPAWEGTLGTHLILPELLSS